LKIPGTHLYEWIYVLVGVDEGEDIIDIGRGVGLII
jgi:hypothetical protein